MSLKIDNTDGTITMYEGDTGHIIVNGLEENRNFYVSFAIQDKKRNFIGKEIVITSNGMSSVDIFLGTNLTDLLKVPQNANYEIYYYGIKISEIGSEDEDTLFIAGKDYGDLNMLLIYPKQAEGIK